MGTEQFRFKNDAEVQQILSDPDLLKEFDYNRSAIVKASIKFYAVHRAKSSTAAAKPPLTEQKKPRRVVLEV